MVTARAAVLIAAAALVGCVDGAADDSNAPVADAFTPANDDAATEAAFDSEPTEAIAPDTGIASTGDGSPDGTDAGPTCKGLGIFCGSRFGLDPTKLYDCNESKLVGVARTCTGKCIEVPDDDEDLCPCPNGDGRYCGGRVGGDAKTLYDCKAGRLTKAAQCGGACTAGTTATSDTCAACPSGNGDYCGSTFGADENKLYTCTNGVLTVKADCGAKCVVKPPGTADVCPACPNGDGKYCGGAVGLDANTLFTCAGGVFTVSEKCSGTCYVAPSGTPDQCVSATPTGGGVLCGNLQWWNATITYGPYVSYGWWDTDLRAASGTKVQLRHASKLDKHGVYGWGWMPEFTDQVTGQRFRFLHLRPGAQYTTQVGKIYPAGTIVGLSGGDTKETGYNAYSTGAHICVQTLAQWRTAFPAGVDPCQ